WAAAMHDDGIDAGLLQEGDIGREGFAEFGVTHCVAAIFHHDGLVLVALHVRQRLRQKFRLKFAVGSGHRYPRHSKMDVFLMYVRSARNKRNGAGLTPSGNRSCLQSPGANRRAPCSSRMMWR